ncbi:hypothetical protein RMCBS344292_16327 [Rhizopus microsporus]|nr:hypothetical protein RMCBS344292_16327 [Rhizopus microsporus]
MNNTQEIDTVVSQELTIISKNLVRAASKTANERIISSSMKRKHAQKFELKEVQEDDGVLVDGMCQSVGTTIKKEAVRLRPSYFQLEYDEKYLVDLGLNSILFLCRSRDAGQARLFSEESWRKLKEVYGQVLENHADPVSKYEEKLSKLEKLGKADLRDARAYAFKNEMKSTRSDQADLFAIYAHYLEVMEYHGYIFDKDIDITEADLTVKMWGGLFEKLFRRAKLRCKWGESVGDSSGAADSPGFKVDLRVIKDTLSRRNKEADIGNMEIARMGASVVKTCSDKSKLLIESKCVLDCLAREHPEQACNIVVPALQIVGNKAVLFSLRLVAPGLYVAVKETAASISSSMSKLKDFRDVAKLLFKFKEATISVANIRLQGGDNSTSISTSNNSNNSDTISWLRGTWIPPRGNMKKMVPDVPHVLVSGDL